VAKLGERVNQLSGSIEDLREKHKRSDRRMKRSEDKEDEFNRRLDRVEDSVDEIRDTITNILAKLEMDPSIQTTERKKVSQPRNRAKLPERIKRETYSDDSPEKDLSESNHKDKTGNRSFAREEKKSGILRLNEEEISAKKLENIL
jgi:hypothetical protein